MSFLEENHYFYTHSLLIKMKGLSDLEKVELYKNFKNGNLTIQDEVRQRISDYYKKFDINDLNLFYSEIIEVIGFYEADFILSNIYLESNTVEILNYIFSVKKTIFFNGLNLNENKKKILLEFEKEYLINKRVTKDFFNLTIFNLLNSLTKNSLIANNNNIFDSLVSKYPIWVANNLEKDIELKSYYWFVILWQRFIVETDISKNILFLHKFIIEYKINLSPYLSKFLSANKNYYQQLFNKKYFIPLITNIENNKSGYFARKSELDKLVFETELLNEESYITLFDKLLDNDTDNTIIRLISVRIEELISKENNINSNIIDELYKKNKNEHTNLFFKKIVYKFYIFKYYNSILNIYPKKNYESSVIINQPTYIFDSTYKPIRFINLAITYNVSPSTIMDFLSTRGYNIKKINNTSFVTEQMYNLIHNEFLKQKNDKSKSKKISFKR